MRLLLEFLPFIAALVVTITSVTLLMSRDWRWHIIVFALQYIGVALLTALSLPIEMAITKMVAGWMSAAVLGMATASVPTSWGVEERYWPSGRLFRLLASLLVLITVLTVLPNVSQIFPRTPLMVIYSGLILASMGLLHLGMTAQPLKIAVGVLTLLAGFEIIYSAVEESTLVAGLLAIINLGIGLIGAYMITARDLEPENE